MFGKSFRALIGRVLPSFQAKVSETAPEQERAITPTVVVNAGQAPMPVAPEKAKRFRRTKTELELGLTIEQAMEARANFPQPAAKMNKPSAVKAAKPVEIKALKRFKRTKAEIDAGLSIEQAAAARGVELPGRQKKIYVERKIDLKPLPSTDLIETLSPRIQSRANIMTTMRRRGVQGVITTEMLDLAAAALAAGKVTKCPTGIDSDGYDHFNQVETR
ncbi:hypothetical protein [Bradyrhizobium sp. DASA03007]|uniref:hypothetical protein n=1 Tax=unclassified Bradyrhizobium TaxID=2631580 RepID=UPI003F70911A